MNTNTGTAVMRLAFWGLALALAFAVSTVPWPA